MARQIGERLAPRYLEVVLRRDRPMGLNNDGDEIGLFNPASVLSFP